MGEVVSYTKDGIDALFAAIGGFATQEDLDAAIAAVLDSAPGALNTLNELAAALGDDPNFASTIVTQLADKAATTALNDEITNRTSADATINAALSSLTASLSSIAANNQTGTVYTLALGDAGLVVELNNASAITLTIPTNALVAFPIGTVIELWQQGAGQVTIAPASGVSLRSPGGLTKIYGQYSGATLRKRATNEWVLQGDLA